MVFIPEPFKLLCIAQKPLADELLDDIEVFNWFKEARKCRVAGYCRHQEGWGDGIVARVPGCRLPFLLQPVFFTGQLPRMSRVVSETYIHGVMEGQAVSLLPHQEIDLV